MIQLIGLVVCFYVMMRGIDWIVVSNAAPSKDIATGRMLVGIITLVGGALCGLLMLVAGLTPQGASPYQ